MSHGIFYAVLDHGPGLNSRGSSDRAERLRGRPNPGGGGVLGWLRRHLPGEKPIRRQSL